MVTSALRPFQQSRICALALVAGFAIAICAAVGGPGHARAADIASVSKKKACKKTQRLRKGKCVAKPKVKAKPKPPAPAPPRPI